MDRMDILIALKKQLEPKLRCNPGSSCWCSQIDFIFDVPVQNEHCLSPQDMLNIANDELTVSDQQYLESLLNFEF